MYRKTPAKFGFMAQTADLTFPMADKEKALPREGPFRSLQPAWRRLLLIVLLVAGP
jgi:hypothetical protein